jgi:hypothetical protein
MSLQDDVRDAFKLSVEYAEEIDRLTKENDEIIRDAFITYSDVDEFVASMKWSDSSTEHEKSLVIGNINGFAAFLNKKWKLAYPTTSVLLKETKP